MVSFLFWKDFSLPGFVSSCLFLDSFPTVADCRSRRASSMDEQRCGNHVQSVCVFRLRRFGQLDFKDEERLSSKTLKIKQHCGCKHS